MPKNTKKRTKVKALPRPEQELTAKAAKKIKGGAGLSTTVSSLNTINFKVKTLGTGKGGFTLGEMSGGELQ